MKKHLDDNMNSQFIKISSNIYIYIIISICWHGNGYFASGMKKIDIYSLLILFTIVMNIFLIIYSIQKMQIKF